MYLCDEVDHSTTMLNGKNLDEINRPTIKIAAASFFTTSSRPAFCLDMFKIIPNILLILIIHENKIRIVPDIIHIHKIK